MGGGEVVAREVRDEIEQEETVEIMDKILGGEEVVLEGVMTEEQLEHVEEEEGTTINEKHVRLSRREFIIQ